MTTLQEEKEIQYQELQDEIIQWKEKCEALQQENEEKDEKILMCEAEIDRTLNQCNQAIVSIDTNVFLSCWSSYQLIFYIERQGGYV